MEIKREISDFQKGWTAGIIDGEGCIHIGKRTGLNRKGFQLRLNVSNTDPKMIIELKNLWGGWTGPCCKDRRGNRKNAWQWIITDTPASKVLEDIFEFLVCKKDQATLAIEFSKSIGCNIGKQSGEIGRRVEIYEKLKDLKNIDFGILMEAHNGNI